MNTRIAAAIGKSARLQELLWRGKFGLETERLRVDPAGWLARTPHPAGLGNKGDHPFITTDFSESQIELITPPADSLDEAHGFIRTLLDGVRSELPPGERLWPQSMPPILPADDDIPLSRFDGDASGRTEYREYLSRIYGRSRQTICGSHFNISLTPEFFKVLASELGESVAELEEAVYLKIVRNLMRDRWFLVALLGRSPLAHETLRLKALGSNALMEVCCIFGTSIRGSAIGYRNPQPLFTDYRSLEEYFTDLNEHIRTGKLLNPNELYLPVRIKNKPGEQAISHIEIRVMDLDPFEPTGISSASLRLLHLSVMYALLKDEPGVLDRAQQEQADALQNGAACWGFSAENRCGVENAPAFPFQEKALELLMDIKRRLELGNHSPAGYHEAWSTFRRFTEDWEAHPASVLKRRIAAEGFIESHLALARKQEEALKVDAFKFHAYPDLELSTQLLLKAAVKRGVDFEILDRTENFIRLSKGAKQEYVVQATKTSLDRYSQILAMENKKVTKRILAEHGIATPDGSDYSSAEEARAHWPDFQGRPIVVKPVSTNFGLGITILKQNLEQPAFDRAIEHAFAEDDQILIETFIVGKEYRFFLIDDQVVAILHRVPANVCGDGQHSIRELVKLKNQDPLRGRGYRTPLEQIRLNEPERLHLAAQNLHFDSIPAVGQTIYLRENSNISTGGDSIDFTDRAHPGYAAVASAASSALGVKITGLDMIVRAIDEPPTAGSYAVIEMNFNPAIHIHCHPYKGENRQLAERILSALGFI